MRTRSTKIMLAICRDQRIKERFWSHVEKCDGAEGCWEWRGYFKTHAYPSLQVGQHSIAPSHLSWFWNTGELPLGGRIHQVCKNPLCVRPSHLAWVIGRATARRLAAEADGYLSISSAPPFVGTWHLRPHRNSVQSALGADD